MDMQEERGRRVRRMDLVFHLSYQSVVEDILIEYVHMLLIGVRWI